MGERFWENWKGKRRDEEGRDSGVSIFIKTLAIMYCLNRKEKRKRKKKSNWKHIRLPEIILNSTGSHFSTTQMEALGLGLKLATGIHKSITTNTILSNYRKSYTDFYEGFIQWMIPDSITQPNDSSFSKWYIQALYILTQNPNIIISPIDKSGGVVIMLKPRYIDKMNLLLEDTPMKYLI